MELHYIWIDDYANIKEQGINISSKYLFSIEIGEAIPNRQGKITIRKNPHYIPDFFEKPNVKNVNAIIGKNGSGKSNILKYIKSNFPEGLNAHVSTSIVGYTVTGRNGKETGFIAFPAGWKIEIDDESQTFKPKEYMNVDMDKSFRFNTDVGKADYIFYSFFLDYSGGGNWAGLTDISTSALIQAERRDKIQRELRSRKLGGTSVNSSDLYHLEGQEIERSIQFLNSEFRPLTPFNPPTELTITIDDRDIRYIESNKAAFKEMHSVIQQLQERKHIKSDYLIAHNDLYIAILANFFVTAQNFILDKKPNLNLQFAANESPKEFVLKFFRNLKNMKLKYRDQDVSVEMFEDMSERVPRLIKMIDELVLNGFITVMRFDNNKYYNYIFKLRQKSDESFRKFYATYSGIIGLTSFLDFRWRGLSTGEQSFLSLMSRFYSAKRHQRGKKFKKDLIILIDEGDAGFHPEWQKQFFKKTLDFLSSLFSDHSIQLLYTANAPFITSDLPKSNIIFIEKINGSSTIHSKENNRQNTFGANIHSLFADSFYMGDQVLMGVFAEKKINQIIDYLNDKKERKIRNDFKEIINLIGEPILKNRLQEMWIEKFGVLEEIDWHRKKIDELEKLRV